MLGPSAERLQQEGVVDAEDVVQHALHVALRRRGWRIATPAGSADGDGEGGAGRSIVGEQAGRWVGHASDLRGGRRGRHGRSGLVTVADPEFGVSLAAGPHAGELLQALL